MQPLVYIIVLNWNDYTATLRCLESLKTMTYSNYRIVVIDNDSSNESVQKLCSIKDIELICNDENKGFAGGNNIGIKKALEQGAGYVWLLNNDATAEANCLEKLVNAAEQDSTIGLISPVIYDDQDTSKIQHCGTRFNLTTPLIEEARDIETAMQWQTENPQQMMVWGTALLIPKNTIEAIGLLDERLFAYAEDSDYSVRSVKAGLKNITVFDARIWHQGHTGIRRPHYYYYTTRNSFLFWKKHLKISVYIRVSWWNFNETLNRISLLKEYPEQLWACLQGICHGILGKGGVFN